MKSPRRTGFTLVELLVVIGIIALLISILLPSLNRARESAREVQCLSNMRQVGLGMLSYTHQYKNTLPPIHESWFTGVSSPTTWGALLLQGKFVGTEEVFYCPSHELPPTTAVGYTPMSYATYWGYFSYGMNLMLGHKWDPVAAYHTFKMNEIRNPSETIMVVENAFTDASPNYGYFMAYPWYGGNPGFAWPRHGKLEKVGVLWVDGHATMVRSSQPATRQGVYLDGSLSSRGWAQDRWSPQR